MGLFFKDDDQPEVKEKDSKKSQSKSPMPEHPPGIFSSKSTIPITGNQFEGHFVKFLKECNIPGPDYFEFTAALKNLDGQPLTDEQKFVSVFSSFSVMGVTKEKLLETADIYLKRIDKEKDEFDAQLQKDTTREIGGRQKNIEGLKRENDELTAKLQHNNTEMAMLNNEIASTNTQLQNSVAGFTQEYQIAVGEINNRINNIKNYLI